jgi:hypothetical protein
LGISITKVDETEDFFRYRVRDPNQFEKMRFPAWAAEVAGSVCEDAKVIMGETEADNWFTQAILIPKDVVDQESVARQCAQEILKKLEED